MPLGNDFHTSDTDHQLPEVVPQARPRPQSPNKRVPAVGDVGSVQEHAIERGESASASTLTDTVGDRIGGWRRVSIGYSRHCLCGCSVEVAGCRCQVASCRVASASCSIDVSTLTDIGTARSLSEANCCPAGSNIHPDRQASARLWSIQVSATSRASYNNSTMFDCQVRRFSRHPSLPWSIFIDKKRRRYARIRNRTGTLVGVRRAGRKSHGGRVSR
jgi:hypothetical protein